MANLQSIRKATIHEESAFFELIAELYQQPIEEILEYSATAWVLENYTTDCPGYQGKIGIIFWPASPGCITTFLEEYTHPAPFSGETRKFVGWKIDVNVHD